MKGKLTFIPAALLLSAAFTLVACGNDDESNNNDTGITPDGKVEVSKNLEFRVNFGDYDSEVEVQGTRAAKTESGDTLGRQYVELGNGLLAEVTVQKDTSTAQTERQRPATRALANDTYTMLVYKGGTYKGEMSGHVNSGVFTATSANKDIVLAPDTYDFVLFNSRVSRSRDNLTVNLTNTGTALIGRTTYTVTAIPIKQKVTFNMKRAGARMRVKLTGYMDIKTGTAATLSSIDAMSVPNTAIYDASTDTWSNGTTAATSGNLTFRASREALYYSATYTSYSNEYMYFLPSTNPSKLKLKFTGGSIYNLDMANAELNLSVPTLTSMAANGSYLINVKLMYNFLYLMSDRTTGLFKATTYGGGTKTPVGIVVSRSKRLAVALKDANGAKVKWYKEYTNQQQNYRVFNSDEEVNSYNDLDGYKYTWESNAPDGSSDIKAEKMTAGVPDYPAFYYAGNYSKELSAELTSQGKALSGGMETKKWHLPSNGEWKYMYTALGFGDGAGLTAYLMSYNWYGYLAKLAFTQVDGTAPIDEWCWSSSEFYSSNAGYILLYPWDMNWGTLTKSSLYPVRAFVYY